MGPFLGNGLFIQDGAAWKHSRALLRPQFASTNKEQNFGNMQKCVEVMLSSLVADNKGTADVVDLQPLLIKLTFNTAMHLLFGSSGAAAAAASPAQADFIEAFDTGNQYIIWRIILGDLRWLVDNKTFRRACKLCHDFIDEAVQRALEEERQTETAEEKQGAVGREPYVFVRALAQDTQDRTVLRDQCINVLLAGRDTAATCLGWTLYVASPATNDTDPAMLTSIFTADYLSATPTSLAG
jgi:cytochrome P450